ncbi:MAG: fibronectin type III domain-containing protein [Desulfobaccales bacterium]
MSPDEMLPGPVKDFRLSQEGNSLVLSWRFPTADRQGQPLTQFRGFSLYRCETPGILPDDRCLKDFVVVADIDLAYPKEARIEGDRVVYQDTRLVPGRRYDYKVAAYGPGRWLGEFSPVRSHAWGVLPQAPRELSATPGDRSVTLTWSPVTRLADGSAAADLAGYHLYRREKGGPVRRLTPEPVREPQYQDVGLKNNLEYIYTVRAVRRLGPDLLESLDSPAARAVPRDLTPPPPPLNLVAVPTKQGVELRWDPSPAPDLAGYRVYRRAAGEPRATLLTPQLLTRPAYVDRQAAPGRLYIYQVTAVDDASPPNESPPSEEAEVGL